jgi:predicted dehydrogenase
MRVALLGDHPDGLDLARALAASGRHELAVYSGGPVGSAYLRRWGLDVPTVGDLEEVLADPKIEAVIVAGSPADRPQQLRRALQSERHVLCAHPADQTPDTAYEAAMIQADTGHLLLPLLTEGLHPAVQRLATLVSGKGLLHFERWTTEQVLLDADVPGHRPGLPGWDVLRRIGGEIAEVSALASGEEVAADEPLVLVGRFEAGGLFQVALLPKQSEPRWRLTAIEAGRRAELTFPDGWPGPARLSWQDGAHEPQQEHWDSSDPWLPLIAVFDAALAGAARPPPRQDQFSTRPLAVQPARAGATVTWTDEVRCLELDDAARRSVARRRASTLEYQTVTEEASFKGTMALTGCAMIWISLLLLIFSAWLPWLGWLVLPLFGIFLVMQLLRWVVPAKPSGGLSRTDLTTDADGSGSRRLADEDHGRQML